MRCCYIGMYLVCHYIRKLFEPKRNSKKFDYTRKISLNCTHGMGHVDVTYPTVPESRLQKDVTSLLLLPLWCAETSAPSATKNGANGFVGRAEVCISPIVVCNQIKLINPPFGPGNAAFRRGSAMCHIGLRNAYRVHACAYISA